MLTCISRQLRKQTGGIIILAEALYSNRHWMQCISRFLPGVCMNAYLSEGQQKRFQIKPYFAAAHVNLCGFNPHLPNGLSHHYHLDVSTFNFRGIRSSFHFYFIFYRNSCEQTVWSQMRCLIWVYTVCICPKKKTPGLYGLTSSVPKTGPWQHPFVEIGHEIISTAILSLLLIQVGQLLVLVNRLQEKCG